MAIIEKTLIKVAATVHSSIENAWNKWTDPAHIVRWNNASPDWHTPRAENDLRTGGRFSYRMEARDGSFGFDFSGTYTKVEPNRYIEFVLDDDRKVQVEFKSQGHSTLVSETFEAESANSVELQESGWQAILDNFSRYVISSGKMEKLNYEISIAAPAQKVYKIMLDEKTFRSWTEEFNPSSHYQGSWEKGSKILFIGTDRDGNSGGMVSRIKENIPAKFVSIEHLGILQGDNEILKGPDVEGWSGALENYTFVEEGSNTRVIVEVDASKEFKSYFEETWPKALGKLKDVVENAE